MWYRPTCYTKFKPRTKTNMVKHRSVHESRASSDKTPGDTNVHGPSTVTHQPSQANKSDFWRHKSPTSLLNPQLLSRSQPAVARSLQAWFLLLLSPQSHFDSVTRTHRTSGSTVALRSLEHGLLTQLSRCPSRCLASESLSSSASSPCSTQISFR